MGAYGSPDLNGQSQYQSSYQPQYYQPQKQKGHGCLVAVVVVLSVVVVFCILIIVGTNSNGHSGSVNSSAFPAAAPVYSTPSVPAAAASAPSVSDEFLKSWAESALSTCLYYPSTTKYSDNPSDWKFSQQGNEYSISSFLTSKNQSGAMGKGDFVVKIVYNDLKAEITYISIGGHVSYDKNKTSSK